MSLIDISPSSFTTRPIVADFSVLEKTDDEVDLVGIATHDGCFI
jgi:hypothetical protein